MKILKIAVLILLSSSLFAGGTGFAQMNIVIKNFPKSFVENLLPKGLMLKQEQDNHPVMFYFSKQNKVSGEIKKFPTAPYIGTFNEFAIAIPNVVHEKHPNKVYKYHHIIYLDSHLGILSAKPYKLKKFYMNLESQNNKFRSTKSDANLINALFYEAPEALYDEHILLNFISQDSIAYSTDKKFQCSSIEWKESQNKVYFTDPEVFVSGSISAQIDEDIYFDYNNIQEKTEGSFYYENRWYLRQKSCFE